MRRTLGTDVGKFMNNRRSEFCEQNAALVRQSPKEPQNALTVRRQSHWPEPDLEVTRPLEIGCAAAADSAQLVRTEPRIAVHCAFLIARPKLVL